MDLWPCLCLFPNTNYVKMREVLSWPFLYKSRDKVFQISLHIINQTLSYDISFNYITFRYVCECYSISGYTLLLLQNLMQMESAVQLDNFQDGRPMYMKTSQQTAQKIKILKTKKQYKELLDLASTMPNNKQKYMLQANACLHLKKWKELSDTCDRGLDLTEEKDSSDLLNLKGKAAGKLGNFEEKVKLTQRAIEIDASVPAYHRNLGAAYYKLKDYDRAVQCHSKAIELQPKHSINYHNKGAAFFRLQKYQDALGCFQKATELDKKQVISFAWLADTYKEMGDYQRAKDYYLRAYEISDQEQYKTSSKEMDQKLNPGKKKGFFSRLFG